MRQKRKNGKLWLRLWGVASAVFLCFSIIHGQSVLKEFAASPKVTEIAVLDILQQLQKQSSFTFIFDEKVLADKTFELDAASQQAFNQFLLKEISRQTDLQFTAISPNTFVVKRRKRANVSLKGKVMDKLGHPMVGANITLIGEATGDITESDGSFALTLPIGTYEVYVSYVGFEPIKRTIVVDGFEDITTNFRFKKHLKLEEILVVGNRFLPKTLQETAVPVDVVRKERLQTANQASISQILQYETPSFHSTHQTISDGTDHVDPISLKGLGPDQVLVLVNGKRRHFSSLVNVNGTVGRGSVGTDLNSIPVAAIEKVEILKDGAAALYGSDAIGGVINLQLKEAVDEGQVQFNSSITEKGDGETVNLSAHYGLKTFEEGHTNLTFYFQNRAATNRSGDYQGIIFGDSRDDNPQLVQDFFHEVGLGGRRVMQAGSAALTNTGLYLNMSAPIGQQFKFYNHSGFNYRNGRATGFYRFPFQKTKQSGLYPIGFLPEINSTIFDFSSVSGIKGIIGNWQIDVSNNLGRNSFRFNVHESNNASLGLNSPTSAEAGGFAYWQNLTNIDVTQKGLGRLPISVAFGTEFRLEQYNQKAGEEVSWENYGETTEEGFPKETGFQVFRGFRAENATRKFRNNVSVYADVEGEISQKLLLAFASRLERYSDFGSRLSWKTAIRYRMTPSFSVRSTYNTGFRAPSLQQNYFSSHSLQFLPVGGNIQSVQVGHENHDSPIVQRLGIPNLQPEISTNFSIGFATKSETNWDFTLDAYHIQINNRIVLSGNIAPTAADPLRDILKSSGVDRVQFFTNAINTKTTGVDARLNYRKTFTNGQLRFFAGLHFNRTKVEQRGSPSTLLSNYQETIFSREEVARLEQGQPASKLILRANYQQNRWHFLLRSTRFGSVQYIHPNDAQSANWIMNEYTGQVESRDQLFAAKWVTDLNVRFHFTKTFHLSLGANNIFDLYPDQHRHFANTYQGLLPYSRRVQQFGVAGRWWSLQATLNI
ncbi:MAG: TonB-dependent receptor [Bacteroidota bacterium]